MTALDVAPDEEPISDESVIEILDALEAQDKLDAEAVVTLASAPDHPLHRYFDWDDETASHQWRLFQARCLIRRPRIRVEVKPDLSVSSRRYTFVRSESRYKATERSLRENHDEVIALCRSELAAFKRKWSSLQQLEAVVREVFPPEGEASK